MSVFVVLTADDKQGVLDPEVVGPFADEASAESFIENHPRHIGRGVIEPFDGGYAGAVLVSAGGAIDPATYMREAGYE